MADKVSFYQGDTVSIPAWKMNDDGTYFDWTGWTIIAPAKLQYSDPTASFNFVPVLTSGSDGKVSQFYLTLSASGSAAVSSSCYVAGVKGIYTGSVVHLGTLEITVNPST